MLTDDRSEDHESDAMLVDKPTPSLATPDSIAADIEHQKLDESRLPVASMSVQNNADSLSPSNKRPNNMDDMSVNPKKRRDPPPSSDNLSLTPDKVGDTDPSDSLEVLDASNSQENFLDHDDDDISHPSPGLLRDLETRAITVSQLIQEVKGIYAGLGK